MPIVRARFAVITFLSVVALVVTLSVAPADAAVPRDSREKIPTVVVTATDFAFDATADIPAGTITVKLKQHVSEPHQAGLVKLRGAATGAEWLAALAKSFTDANALGTFVAGPNTSAPGHTSAVTVDVTPGRYLIVCLIPSPDGVPHIVKGMMRDLTVTGTPRRVRVPKTATITLRNYAFMPPHRLRAGETVTVVNRGREAHEMVVVKLKPGKTVQDLVAWDHPAFQPEPFPQPYLDQTGTTAMAPGATAHVQLPKHAGHYLLVCFIPDANGKSHFRLGMIHPITLK